MTPRRLAALFATLALAAAAPAAADSHKLMVLQSEGRVDAATRAKIDAAVTSLARHAEPQTTAGELTFTDAAIAVGCRPDTAQCRSDVLAMLAVDEIVITTLARKPGGIEITVHRVHKGGAARDATMLLAPDAPPDHLAGIAPLFHDAPPAPTPAPAPAPALSTPAGPGPATAAAEPPPGPVAQHEQPAVIPPPSAVAPPPASPIARPTPADPFQADQPSAGRRRLELAGMAGGAGMLAIGVLLWGVASGVQSDINKAPTSTQQDLAALRDLESKGDAYATAGNLLAITGVAVAGVATYFYLADRRSSGATARIAPAVLEHGAGLTLTIGGAP